MFTFKRTLISIWYILVKKCTFCDKKAYILGMSLSLYNPLYNCEESIATNVFGRERL